MSSFTYKEGGGHQMFTYFLGGSSKYLQLSTRGRGGSIMFEILSTQNKDSPQSEFTNHVATMRAEGCQMSPLLLKVSMKQGQKFRRKVATWIVKFPQESKLTFVKTIYRYHVGRTRVGAICYYLIRLIFCGNNSQLGIHYLVSSYAISKYKDKNLEFIYFFCKMSQCLELVAWTQEC